MKNRTIDVWCDAVYPKEPYYPTSLYEGKKKMKQLFKDGHTDLRMYDVTWFENGDVKSSYVYYFKNGQIVRYNNNLDN